MRRFHEKRFDRERGEECLGFAYVGDGCGAMGGEETGIGFLGNAALSDQIAACEQINDAAHFFGKSIG